jgi:hypothetical protein
LYQGKQKQPDTYYFSRDNTVKKYDLPVHPVFFFVRKTPAQIQKLLIFGQLDPKKLHFCLTEAGFER